MVNHYRWDFIGLSTDNKPTPATSEKVADGSTFYCSDNSKLYVWYKNQWYEKEATGGGGGEIPVASDSTLGGVKIGGGLYMSGNDDEILNVSFISGLGDDTTATMNQNDITSMVYADPGTHSKIQIGSNADNPASDSIVIGTDASCDGGAPSSIAIGANALISSDCTGDGIALGDMASVNSEGAIAIGANSQATGDSAIALGANASTGNVAAAPGSVSIGRGASAGNIGEVNIGAALDLDYGYNGNSPYRILTGVETIPIPEANYLMPEHLDWAVNQDYLFKMLGVSKILEEWAENDPLNPQDTAICLYNSLNVPDGAYIIPAGFQVKVYAATADMNSNPLPAIYDPTLNDLGPVLILKGQDLNGNINIMVQSPSELWGSTSYPGHNIYISGVDNYGTVQTNITVAA